MWFEQEAEYDQAGESESPAALGPIAESPAEQEVVAVVNIRQEVHVDVLCRQKLATEKQQKGGLVCLAKRLIAHKAFEGPDPHADTNRHRLWSP